MLTRRNLLRGAGIAAGAAMLPAPAHARSRALAIPPGLQLWTVKDELAKDFTGTLRQLRRIGYRRVESAGWVGRSPADYAAALRDAGLECTSCHFGLRDLMSDAETEKRLAEVKAVGASYVVASSPAPDKPINAGPGKPWSHAVAEAMTLSNWQSNAERMNRVGAMARAMGLRFGYHNHSAEFLLYDGKLPWSEFMRITDPELVVFELDIGWVAGAGLDPVEVLRQTGSRTHLLHIKDLKSAERRPNRIVADETTVPIGKGTIDWKGVFDAASQAPIHSWFVEQEAPFTQPPLDALAQSFAYLETLKG